MLRQLFRHAAGAVAVVYEDGQAETPGQLELAAKYCMLISLWRVVAVEVEPGFTNCAHAIGVRQCLDVHEPIRSHARRFVRMYTRRAPELRRIPLAQGDGCPAARNTRPGDDHRPDAYGASACNDLVDVGRKSGVRQIDTNVDQRSFAVKKSVGRSRRCP